MFLAFKWVLCVFYAVIAASYAHGSDSGRGPQLATSDVIGSVLTTLFQGDSSRTSDTLSALGRSYEQFLNDFTREPYCADFPGSTVRLACDQFKQQEVARIHHHKWSYRYSFAEAEFASETAVYNFVRSVELHPSYRCTIFLQLSVNLKSQMILNQEYWADCPES